MEKPKEGLPMEQTEQSQKPNGAVEDVGGFSPAKKETIEQQSPMNTDNF